MWVMNTMRAAAPSPSCSIDLIETLWVPNTLATAASTPGWSLTSARYRVLQGVQANLRATLTRTAGVFAAGANGDIAPDAT